MAKVVGTIVKVSGPVVVAKKMTGVQMYEVVRVGDEGLIGEVIELEGDNATVQVYEDTTGIGPGGKVEATGYSLSVELGPGILSNIYDGIQRPLSMIEAESGSFIERGIDVRSLDVDKKWDFEATIEKGTEVSGGTIVGQVQECKALLHKIMVPPDVEGTLTEIKSGSFTVDEVIGKVKTKSGVVPLKLVQRWPVRFPRPTKTKLEPTIPLISGLRIIDTFNPVAKGGTACTPGAFGTGKTVTQQSLAKWCDAEVIVYIGCGERGNEMTDVLTSFPKLTDPKSGNPLLERTVIIANTSNMPVAAREASVYTGITIAEYFRDQGYHVALMADSTSRWAEAMREISGRLEEMPGEEGYPAYLATRLSQFYERAGRVQNLNESEGSVTVVGAISPPGGDFSEPVTQGTLRVNKTFWALDKALASQRHFPAINWLDSYSLYLDSVQDWFIEQSGKDWRDCRDEAMRLLQKEEQLQEIVQLVGPDALPPAERVTLEVAKMLREDFLQQNAFHDVDSYCSPAKQYMMLKTILLFNDLAAQAVSKGADVTKLSGVSVLSKIARMKEQPEEGFDKVYKGICKDIKDQLAKLA